MKASERAFLPRRSCSHTPILRYAVTFLAAVCLFAFTQENAKADEGVICVFLTSTNHDDMTPSYPSYNAANCLAVTNNGRWSITAWVAPEWKTSGSSNIGLTVPGPQTLSFNHITNFYKPINVETTIQNDVTNYYTNCYIPYSNLLSVTIIGPAGSNPTWQITAPADFLTNCSAYQPVYTNSQTNIFPIPTGEYTIVFGGVLGYNTPITISTNIAASRIVAVTGAYTRIYGNLSYSLRAFKHDYITNYGAAYDTLLDRVKNSGQWTLRNVDSDLIDTCTNLEWAYNLDTNAPPNPYQVAFNRVQDCYQPANVPSLTVTNSDMLRTNFYYPYSNSLAVTIAGLAAGATSTWQITSFTELTNSSLYKTRYTNSLEAVGAGLFPTGVYTITFLPVSGYIEPITTNIAVSRVVSVTGTYTLAAITTSVLTVRFQPVGAQSTAKWWVYDNILMQGPYTNNYSRALAVSNDYEISYGAVRGYKYSAPTNLLNFYGDRILTNTFIPYSNDLAVTIAGITTATNVIWTLACDNPEFSNSVHYGAKFTNVFNGTVFTNTYTVTAVPTGNYTVTFPNDLAGYTLSSANPQSTNIVNASPLVNGITGIYEYISLSSTIDSDGNGLPDGWEMHWFGHLTNDPTANPDNDWIPSASTNTPILNSIFNGVYDITFSGNAAASYPLQHDQLLEHRISDLPKNGSQLGYSKGEEFTTFRECKGLDGYYLTNGPNGTWVPDDDPKTDPTKFDTFDSGAGEDGISDGWKYYFWYWRSGREADGSSAGIGNSANLSWVNFWRVTNGISVSVTGIDMDDGYVDGDKDGFDDTVEYYDTWTDPTHCDTDGDSMDDKWEYDFDLATSKTNALDNLNGSLNPDGDFMASVTNTVLTNGMVGTVLGNVCWFGGTAANPSAAWWDQNNNSNFDLYYDTILKASAVTLTNRTTGTRYAWTNYYGTNAGLTSYKNGYPVWVDVDNSGTYTTNDYALVNPTLKHDAVYCMAPAFPGPGVCSFDPRTAWTNAFPDLFAVIHDAPNTIDYTTYQEYLGRDYLGRISWNVGGQKIVPSDNAADDTNPNYQDSEPPVVNGIPAGDGMPDGWELYVGLNPNLNDATGDPDLDALDNLGEWANATHPLGTCIADWPNKPWPTDPGVITAPAPNDPHPRDTDWDGLVDGYEQVEWTFDASDSLSSTTTNIGEFSSHSNPTDVDTDRYGSPSGDGLPDGWEVYAGTDPLARDSNLDSDYDGLLNWQEYWTGTVPEWMDCDPSWNPPVGIKFIARRYMNWNPSWQAAPTNDQYTTFGSDTVDTRWFLPPDFMTCPSFLYANGAITNLNNLRTNFPAHSSLGCRNYHTTLASTKHVLTGSPKPDPTDSDSDGMDDFWEVFHCLDPIRGYQDRVFGVWNKAYSSWFITGSTDADPTHLGNQVGLTQAISGFPAGPFAIVMDLVTYYRAIRAVPDASMDLKVAMVRNLVGPHNFGLVGMDPDGDGQVNFSEYHYYMDRSLLHTCPSPLYRTDASWGDANYNFIGRNFTRDNTPLLTGWGALGFGGGLTYRWNDSIQPFRVAAMTEGFDTDNDMLGDFNESTGYREGTNSVPGTDPLNDESPIKNRVLWLDGTNSYGVSHVWSPYGDFTRFTVEAWVRPSRLITVNDQVVVEKASAHEVETPDGDFVDLALANFQLGISASGMPYVLFHGVSGYTTHRAISARVGILQANTWAHLAGVFDGANLTLYVNGEVSATHPTTEVPARGITGDYDQWHDNAWLSVGARGVNDGGADPEKFFAGCISEVRVWDRVLTAGDIRARKNRRLLPAEVGTILGGNNPYLEGTNNLFAYYRFAELPDPKVEGIRPSGFPANRPAFASWNPSLVYTNYLVVARDRVKNIPRMPPLDTRVIDGVPVATNGTPDTYGISTTNYLGIVLPDDFRNSANPYNFTHWTYVGHEMGRGLTLYGYAQGLKTNSWLGALDPDDPDSTDTDGDCLPDWWEQLYGLDPNSAVGDNGKWGDPDNDGLNNLAEYLAGTDPFSGETYPGIGDYDYHSGPYTRTLGEIYMDGDGMPDVWESLNGLDPQKYDANLDLDGDGWSNYAEYQGGTAPNNKYDYPQPIVVGDANYYGNRTGMLRFYAYETNAMDGVPQITKVGTDSLVSEVVGQANGTLTFTGRLPIAPIDVATVVRISAALTNGMFVSYTFTGPEAYTYSGPGTDYAANLSYVSGRFTLIWASSAVPAAGANVSVQYSFVNRNAAAFSLEGFKEGDFYVLALMDTSGDGSFNANEPMGIMDDQPSYLSYSSISGIRVLLTDTRPGFGRFNWTAVANTGAYPVIINKLSESGAPNILTRAMVYPRNYFHEWDFQLQGIEGLMAGTYQWWMGTQKGTFSVNWPASLAKPTLIYPRGAMLYYSRNQFAWTMDLNCPMAHMQITRGATTGTLVTDKYIRAPWMDEQRIYRGWMDEYANDWGNGVYYWRVAGWTPQGESAWSDWQTFNVNLSATNSCWVSGDISYFGKAPATKIIVEAYDNRGFGGAPVARMTLTPPASTGITNYSYTLRGLEPGAYYVRAFLDISVAGGLGANSQLDVWESTGFYRDPNNFYQAGLVDLTDKQFLSDAKIIIRDKNTDNDELPDAWEMYYFGNLDQTGDMDYDGDGETNLDEYIRDGVILNPACWDTDGDGLSDGFEAHYNGVAFGFGTSANSAGTVLNPNVRDTDSDGYSDGAELLRYHTNPLNSNDNPVSRWNYQPMCFDAAPSPGDYDGDGRSDLGVYDSSARIWSYSTMAGHASALTFGINQQAQPLVGDYDGDGCTDFSFYDKGRWTVYFTQSGRAAGGGFGNASMVPVPGDYDGDGHTELAVYDTANSLWYTYNIPSGRMFTGKFGGPGMIPVPGDYNGDGATDYAVYAPATGRWMVGCYHKYYKTWNVCGGGLGGPAWTPVPGDYDGDGRNDICVFNESTGRWMLFTMAGKFGGGGFGWPGCVAVPGDYDGDGRTDLAVYDTNTGIWCIYCWGAYHEYRFGGLGELPITKGR